MKLNKNEIPNKYKKQFFKMGCMVGEKSKQHPEQIIQETWNNWIDEFSHLDMSQWLEAFESWKKGFLLTNKTL